MTFYFRVKVLTNVIQNVKNVLSDDELESQQLEELRHIATSCGHVLEELEQILHHFRELNSSGGSPVKKAKRALKRFNWEPEDIEQLRSRIMSNITLLNAFSLRITQSSVVFLVRTQDDDGRQPILDWITKTDYAPKQCDFIALHQPGTGQWLLNSVEFESWLNSNKQTLFCPGIPGVGKTIITSIVIKELNTRFDNDGKTGVAFIYCNYSQQHDQKLRDLLASLLKQLVQERRPLPQPVKTLHKRHQDKRSHMSVDELLGALELVMATYERVFILVDALDECSRSGDCQQRLITSLLDLQAKFGANLFLTSRPISRIEEQFKGNTILEIRAREEDVRKYLDGHMSLLPKFVAQSPDLQEEIKARIVEAVDGM